MMIKKTMGPKLALGICLLIFPVVHHRAELIMIATRTR